MSVNDFYTACQTFSEDMTKVAGWKWQYHGYTYTSRLEQAVADARKACDAIEAAMKADEKAKR